jgi:transposase
MPQSLVDDGLWAHIEPLLPKKRRRKRNTGRLPLCDRRVLSGILFVLRSGIPWEMLPKEMGCGSGMTCWRRLKHWQKTRGWNRLHQTLLSKLRGVEKLDFSRVIADSSSIRAVGAGKKVDRTQPIAVVRAVNTTCSRTPKASGLRPY